MTVEDKARWVAGVVADFSFVEGEPLGAAELQRVGHSGLRDDVAEDEVFPDSGGTGIEQFLAVQPDVAGGVARE